MAQPPTASQRAAIAAGFRDFLRPDLELLPGKYPNRPFPGHVANNLAVIACGRPTAPHIVRRLARRGELLAAKNEHTKVNNLPFERPFPGTDDWSPRTWDDLATSVRTAFDPDHLVFPTEGSPAIVDWRLSSSVGSDDTFAQAVWRTLPSADRGELATELRDLYDATNRSDSLSRLAALLVKAASDPDKPVDVEYPEATEDAATGTPFGVNIARLLHRVASFEGDGRRLSRIRQVGTLTFAAVVLGMLYEGGRFAHSEKGDADVRDALGILVFTGETPGDPNDRLVVAAQRSLATAISHCQEGIAVVASRLVNQLLQTAERVPFGMGRVLVDQRLGPGASSKGNGAALAVALDDGALEVSGDTAALHVQRLLPASCITRSVRTMGVKVGLVGPARGVGSPRLNVETNLLAALATSIAAPQGTALPDLIEGLHQRLGLVLGPVDLTASERSTLESAVSGVDDLDSLLSEAASRLRQRLVRAGLARRYSDGYTMVYPR